MARGKRGNKHQLWLPTKKNIKEGCHVLSYTFTRIERVKGRRKYKQVQQKCGAHAINNLLGKEQEVVSYEDMESTATQLAASATRKFGDDTGNWHSSVLKLALRAKGFDMRTEKNASGNFRDHMWLGSQTQGKFIALGWVGGGNQAHWFCVDADCGLVIDSAEPGFLKHDIAGVLKACPYGVAQVYRVTRRE
jgi:hypothetical protein